MKIVELYGGEDQDFKVQLVLRDVQELREFLDVWAKFGCGDEEVPDLAQATKALFKPTPPPAQEEEPAGGDPDMIPKTEVWRRTGVPWVRFIKILEYSGVKPIIKGSAHLYPVLIVEKIKEIDKSMDDTQVKKDEEYMRKHREEIGTERRPGID